MKIQDNVSQSVKRAAALPPAPVKNRALPRALRRAAFILLAAVSVAACVQPAHAQSEAPLSVKVGADMPVVAAGKKNTVVVRVLLEPAEVLEKSRAPLAVALVLDKSGSMSANGKMENAKLGAIEALNRLDMRDIVSVVAYDSAVNVVAPAGTAGSRRDLNKMISRLRAGGNTALYAGVESGAKQLLPFIGEGYAARIVLLSDGMANVGPFGTVDLAKLGRYLCTREITVTTIGLGLDYNEDLMTALAAESGGNAYFAKNANMLKDIFARDMEDALALTARRLRVTLTCRGGAVPRRAIGRTGIRRGKAIEVVVGNLYDGKKYALFEIETPANGKENVAENFSVDVAYVDARSGKDMSAKTSYAVTYAKDQEKIDANRDGEIAAQAEIAKNAEIREEAVKLADEGKAKEAASLLERRAGEIREAAASAPKEIAPKMEEEARQFEGTASGIAASGAMTNESRKQNVNDAYKIKNQQAPSSSDSSGRKPSQ